MRALRFHAAHDLRIEDVAEPPAPGRGEVVVRVVTCGICGTDLHEYLAGPIVTPVEPHPLTGAQNPQILGHEFAGDVVAVGPGVTRVREGDRVAIMPLAYCGHCAYCQRGLQHLCATMACVGLSHPWGGMAELATVAEYQIVRLPAGVTHQQGALIEPTAVAAYGVERAGVGPGRPGARDGSRADRRARRALRPLGRRLLRLHLGAEPGATGTRRGARGRHRARPDGRRRSRRSCASTATASASTWSIECSGHPSGFTTGIRSLRRRGTLAQTGLFVGEASVEPMLWSLNDLTIVGTWCYWVYDFERIAAQIAAGDLPVERVITSSGTLDDAPDAFASLASGKADEIKVLINQ